MGFLGGSRINGQLIALLGFVLVCLTVTFIIAALLPRLVPKERSCQDHNVDGDVMELSSPSGAKLTVWLNHGKTVKKPGKYLHCTDTDKYMRHTQPQPGDNTTCKEYRWKLNQFDSIVTDCFDLAGQSWFGGSSLWRQDWPLNTAEQNRSAYVPGDVYQRQYGGVMERYWISTGGFSIFVEDQVPLYVELRANRLCLTGSLEEGPYNITAKRNNGSRLAYTVCKGKDIRGLYRATKFWESPSQTPDRDLFRRPIWSTWAYLKSNITQESVIEFAQNISDSNLSASQLEIDDQWSTNYGDHAFDSARFPEPRRLVDAVHALGYNVTLWVHPFVNRGTGTFAAGLDATRRGASFLVANGNNATEPALTSWWRGTEAAIIDVTDDEGEGTRHLESLLKKLRTDYAVDSFKLDGGETNWLPAGARLASGLEEPNPGWFAHAWARLGHRVDPDRLRLEVRVGFRAQQLPLLVRSMDKDSHWGLDNGLRSMVTSALTHCLIGYNFHLPDMVGGNAYCAGPDGLDGRCFPKQELYIRWLQAAVFMPTLQLSVPPWLYGQTVVDITRRLLDIREEARFVQNMDAGLQAVRDSGDPLVRPMWWPDGGSPDVADQFMLGQRILVAPVLDEGATERLVRLPRGRWLPWNETDASRAVDGGSEEPVRISVPMDSSVGAFWLLD